MREQPGQGASGQDGGGARLATPGSSFCPRPPASGELLEPSRKPTGGSLEATSGNRAREADAAALGAVSGKTPPRPRAASAQGCGPGRTGRAPPPRRPRRAGRARASALSAPASGFALGSENCCARACRGPWLCSHWEAPGRPALATLSYETGNTAPEQQAAWGPPGLASLILRVQ